MMNIGETGRRANTAAVVGANTSNYRASTAAVLLSTYVSRQPWRPCCCAAARCVVVAVVVVVLAFPGRGHLATTTAAARGRVSQHRGLCRVYIDVCYGVGVVLMGEMAPVVLYVGCQRRGRGTQCRPDTLSTNSRAVLAAPTSHSCQSCVHPRVCCAMRAALYPRVSCLLRSAALVLP